VGLLQLFLFLLAKQSVVSLCVMINGLIYLHWAMQAMQRYYRATSRELRRLDSVSRSHVYTTFTEVLDGSGTIRAFKAQAQFVTKNWKMVATNMEASYSELSASLWLTFRLQVKLSL
jgi:ATP-binding cassette subfamily C (CFTR/MRP) protein 10